MILEYAQILCTTHRVIDGLLVQNKANRKTWIFDDSREHLFYKSTHVNHPSVVWARQSVHNYNWLYSLFSNLSSEYEHRYHKIHLSWQKLNKHLKDPPALLLTYDASFTSPPLAMPDHCKIPDSAIASYRNYYVFEKISFCEWTNRVIPEWFLNILYQQL